ncbi:MAG: M23 family metallopeptidase [Nanoarchaeota archaeon]|nr:M23 family metallopeptidase [Nanoarchaeota archaeon]
MKTSLKNMVIKLSLAGLLAVSSSCSITDAQKNDYKLQWPLDNPAVTQKFGENKGTMYRDGHLGVDMTEYFGAPVKAAAEGVVVARGSDNCSNFEEPNCNYGFGNWIMLWHPELKVNTVYSHLEEQADKDVGLEVKQGETIGYEGGSGFQFDTGTLEQVTGDESRHHLDFMVGKFHIYTTFEDKTDFQLIEIYDPFEFLPPLK